MMRRKGTVLFSIGILCLTITGCGRPYSVQPSEKNVTIAALDWINEDIEYVGSSVEKEVEDAYTAYFYEFEDARGIPFTVEVQDYRLFDLFNNITKLYSNTYYYCSNYRNDVIAYYKHDILDILETIDYVSCDFDVNNGANIKICVSAEEDPEAIADAIMEIDSLLDLEENNCTAANTGEANSYHWDDYHAHKNLHIVFVDKETGDSRGNAWFNFNNACENCDEHTLTYEDVLDELNSALNKE